MAYAWAPNFNNAGSLVTLTVQPRSDGIALGTPVQQADVHRALLGFMRTQLIYSYITKAQYDTILTEFGLVNKIRSVEGTLQMPRNHDRVDDTYNAVVMIPTEPRYHYAWERTAFDVVLVQALGPEGYW